MQNLFRFHRIQCADGKCNIIAFVVTYQNKNIQRMLYFPRKELNQLIGILIDKFANSEMLHSNIPNDSPYEINVFIYDRPFVKIKYKYAVCCFAVDIVEII